MDQKDIINAIQKDLTKEQAQTIYMSQWWQHITPKKAALLQLQQSKLCMPFTLFHEYTETLMERGVFTHEFANPDKLLAELISGNKASLNEIMGKLPDIPTITVIEP